MKKLDFGLSPCPNDTYIFYKFIQQSEIVPHFLDVEELNQLAYKEEFPLIKVSCYTALQLKNYVILKNGGAMGYGCGPILVSGNKMEKENLILSFQNSTILIPGKNTTANFLFKYFCKKNHIEISKLDIQYTRYDQIIPTLQKEKKFFGILIHEERFTYQAFNLFLITDLGEWWEKETNLPIPLGCIVLHKDLLELKEKIENQILESILYSKNFYDEVLPFIRKYAQSMDDKAIKQHIDLYVTDFSYDMKDKGRETLRKMKSFILSSY